MKTEKPINRIMRIKANPDAIGDDREVPFKYDINGDVKLNVDKTGIKKIIIEWTLEFIQEGRKDIALIFVYEASLVLLSVVNQENDSPIAEHIIQNSYIATETAFRPLFKDFPFERPEEKLRILSIRLMESLVYSGEY